MAYERGDFDANLSIAAGEDAALRAELMACFAESVALHVDLLQRARCDGNWEMAAQRLRSLGSSFHAPALVGLAEEALDSAPGDPVIVRKLRGFAAEFTPAA